MPASDTAKGGSRLVEPRAWVACELSDEGLRLWWMSSPYYTVERTEVEASASAITVTLFERLASGPIPSIAVARSTQVRLSSPLGERPLLDGTTHTPRPAVDRRDERSLHGLPSPIAFAIRRAAHGDR